MLTAFIVILGLSFACSMGSFAGTGIESLAWNGGITSCNDCGQRIVDVSDLAARRLIIGAVILAILAAALLLIMAL